MKNGVVAGRSLPEAPRLSERVIIRNPDLKRRYLALWEWLCDARANPQQVKPSLAQITTGRTTQRIIAFAEGKSLSSSYSQSLYINLIRQDSYLRLY
jgi:hypothetical protein